LQRGAHTVQRQVETFPDGEVLLDYCDRYGFEGIVSKRRTSGYASGSRHWLKIKCPNWKRANAERGKAFEKKLEPSERETQLQKKHAEPARVSCEPKHR